MSTPVDTLRRRVRVSCSVAASAGRGFAQQIVSLAILGGSLFVVIVACHRATRAIAVAQTMPTLLGGVR